MPSIGFDATLRVLMRAQATAFDCDLPDRATVVELRSDKDPERPLAKSRPNRVLGKWPTPAARLRRCRGPVEGGVHLAARDKLRAALSIGCVSARLPRKCRNSAPRTCPFTSYNINRKPRFLRQRTSRKPGYAGTRADNNTTTLNIIHIYLNPHSTCGWSAVGGLAQATQNLRLSEFETPYFSHDSSSSAKRVGVSALSGDSA
jgi:hypothetical protein